MSSVKPIIGQLEDLFEIFNEEFYDGELERPVITVSPDITSGAYGWATSWKAWQEHSNDDSDGYYELNMCAEHLARPFEELCATLLHEMVHLWNLQNDVKDTSRSGTYHNKRFKKEAEQRGLIIEQGEKYGWHITTLNDDAKEIVEDIEEHEFQLYRTRQVKVTSQSKKSSSRKYVCPNCGTIVRATKEVRIICADCDIEMELEE